MTHYQLLRLIELAGEIQTRKRLQKTVHLLQAGGYDLGVTDFRLHYYGPYSADLAECLDVVSSQGLLAETEESGERGKQFNYRLADGVAERLRVYEQRHANEQEPVDRARDVLDRLLVVPPRDLEFASTIAEFWRTSRDWDAANRLAAEFKQVPESDPAFSRASKLAKEVVEKENAK